ncbi:chromate efflux transporter [Chthonobacter rhizosphaerae]|uniref:chromate efflux transporter n=1 Tax=Chthonobacter rhizosphaerae TaxID=2735553 RepID=UPI0015EFC979|nr:chromate efflux transporter [Chthonobacter rhizosphaerae]
MDAPDTPAAPPTLSDLAAVFARVGVLGFGGPAGQIALMHRMIIDERGWLTERRYLAALNYCMLLPGPEAQQLATYVGWHLHGVRGGLIAGLLFVLPGFVVITAIAAVYAAFGETPLVDALFFGLQAAVLAIVVEALIRIARRSLTSPLALGLAGAAFLAIFALHVPFPVVILVAAAVGAVFGRGVARPVDAGDPPRPRSAAGTVRTALVWLSVWGSLPLLVALATGFDGTFARLGAFFSSLAVVTFGGAYAALAYVAQAAVATYGWLTAPEMLDALAMAETTPGPLVLVLVFIGYLAGFREPGGFDPVTGGLLGALVTAWVTFAPSFLWIFVGAPYVERIIASPRLGAALSAVTAAVVGVILNLTVWFALNVLFREVGTATAGPVSVSAPVLASLDPAALALSIVAAVMVFRLKAGLTVTLAVSAALGLLVVFAPRLL